MKKESDIQFPDEWKIVVARNFEEIEAIRPIWEQMQRNEPCPKPNADIDRYLSVVKARGDSIRPHVMLFKHNGNPAAMIVGWVGKHQLELKLGYKALLKPSLRCLSVVYGGILDQPEGDYCSLLIGALREQLRSREVDVVYFNHIRTDTAFYQAVQEIPGFLSRDHLPKTEPHWVMSVPQSIESFYQSCSSSSRKQYRKCVRRLEGAFPDQVRMATYCQESQLDEAIRYASQISAKSYQYSMGCGFEDNSFTRILLARLAQKGWLRVHILFVGDEACAFEIWLQYGKTYFGNGIGFDPKWKKWRIGTVLFLETIKRICADPSVDSVDFGFGDAAYKRSYGNRQWQEASAYIFSLRPYPVIINILQSSVRSLNAALQYVVQKIGSFGWIKRQWRHLLQAKNQDSKCRIER